MSPEGEKRRHVECAERASQEDGVGTEASSRGSSVLGTGNAGEKGQAKNSVHSAARTLFTGRRAAESDGGAEPENMVDSALIVLLATAQPWPVGRPSCTTAARPSLYALAGPGWFPHGYAGDFQPTVTKVGENGTMTALPGTTPGMFTGLSVDEGVSTIEPTTGHFS